MARRPSMIWRIASGTGNILARSPLLRIPSAADHILIASHKSDAPLLLAAFCAPLTHARLSALGLLGSALILLALYLPFWLIALLITEIGVYVLIVLAVFKIGRSIVRLIAFPGSTQRVYGEIETEFAKYSVRMLDASCASLIEVGNTIVGCGDPDESNHGEDDDEEDVEGGDGTVRSIPPKLATYVRTTYGASPADVGPLWRRAASYRDKVLGMYSDVLVSLLDDDPNSTSAGSGSGSAGTATPPTTIASSSNAAASVRLAGGLTRYGNNTLTSSQCVGNLGGVSSGAIDDGRVLAALLGTVLRDLDDVERAAINLIRLSPGTRSAGIRASGDAVRAAKKLVNSTGTLRDFLPCLKASAPGGGGEGEADGEDHAGGNGGAPQNMKDAARAALASVLPVLDPPPHASVFGLDVLRGSTLSRYRGSRQLWVDRPRRAGGGRLDVLHIPAIETSGGADTGPAGEGVPGSPTGPGAAPPTAGGGRRTVRKAVMYCNPNAGLSEVAAGMSLVGGNVHPEDANGTTNSAEENCWTDFYIHAGYDVFLFNYAGFGRSHGGRPRTPSYKPGCLPSLARMVRSSLFDFCPTPSSLKADALAVAQHIAGELGAEHVVIHGESIGGMAAASAARQLSTQGMDGTGRGRHPSLLLVDRSFANLQATAQRLVGSWTGPAISALVPLWNTDVADDFLSALCPKVAACDAADAIIADGASLKSGIAVGMELRGGRTGGVGSIVPPPVEYRMSDHEGAGVTEGKIVKCNKGVPVMAPVWPRDRRVGSREAFHFAACARRVGKVATTIKRRAAQASRNSSAGGFRREEGRESDEEEGIEITELGPQGGSRTTRASSSNSDFSSAAAAEAHVTAAWKALACADGLTGSPLGAAVRDGHDCAVTWLCCSLTYGGQVVADRAASRHAGGSVVDSGGLPRIEAADFNSRPGGYSAVEGNEDGAVHPMPLPEVIAALRAACDGLSASDTTGAATASAVPNLAHELRYCAGVLEYVAARLTSERIVSESRRALDFHATIGGGGDGGAAAAGASASKGERNVGRFMDLRCGHNNQYSAEERERLKAIMGQVMDGNEGGSQMV